MKTITVYNSKGDEVVIDNTPEQIDSWEKAGYSTTKPAPKAKKPIEEK